MKRMDRTFVIRQGDRFWFAKDSTNDHESAFLTAWHAFQAILRSDRAFGYNTTIEWHPITTLAIQIVG